MGHLANPQLHYGMVYNPPNLYHLVDGNSVRLTPRAGLLGFYIELEFLGDASDWTDQRKATFMDAADRCDWWHRSDSYDLYCVIYVFRGMYVCLTFSPRS